jgi:hypothetical protein
MIRRGLLPSGLPLSDPLGVSHSVGNLTQLPPWSTASLNIRKEKRGDNFHEKSMATESVIRLIIALLPRRSGYAVKTNSRAASTLADPSCPYTTFPLTEMMVMSASMVTVTLAIERRAVSMNTILAYRQPTPGINRFR